MLLRVVPCFPVAVVVTAAMLTAAGLAGPCLAQSSDFNLNVHANSHATAKEIGLPEYPGATPYKDKDSDSSSVDLGLLLNSFHFSVQAASYITTDSPEQVLAFYRKPLAKYGEVLECDHGKPVGALTVTKSGLTCGDKQSGHVSVNGTGDSDHELRAGTPEQFRIVGIDSSEAGKTKFGLVALVVPKETSSK
jgi:hypothetical protein